MSVSSDRILKRSPLGPADLLGTSLNTNSVLDSEEDFREEDIWGSNETSEQSSEVGSEKATDFAETSPGQASGGNTFLLGKGVGGGTGSDLKPLGISALTQGRANTPSRMIPKSLASIEDRTRLRRQSAPVNVPVWSKSAIPIRNVVREPERVEIPDHGRVIPPHELLAREYSQSMTFSVHSGAGRTLKGRDLSSVRNAVLRQTGFFDG